jgi:ABC-type multidrug transport system fused ATPase/permease subunit
MHCFYHQDTEAVGSCKVCAKGLCAACAADLGLGLACRNQHEARAAAVEQLTTDALQVQTTAGGGAKYVGSAFMGFLGVILVGYGYHWGKGDRLLLVLGVGFIVYSLVLFRLNQRAYKRARANAG